MNTQFQSTKNFRLLYIDQSVLYDTEWWIMKIKSNEKYKPIKSVEKIELIQNADKFDQLNQSDQSFRLICI